MQCPYCGGDAEYRPLKGGALADSHSLNQAEKHAAAAYRTGHPVIMCLHIGGQVAKHGGRALFNAVRGNKCTKCGNRF